MFGTAQQDLTGCGTGILGAEQMESGKACANSYRIMTVVDCTCEQKCLTPVLPMWLPLLELQLYFICHKVNN